MIDALTVAKVASKADYRAFITFPWTLYRTSPYWVPPLMSMQKHKFDQKKNPTWQHLEGDYFLARRGKQVLGTIAAYVNRRHNEFHDENIAFFGAFETINDQAVADALLNTAVEWAQARGYDALRGPATFSTNDECGVLVQGFDDPPAVLMPYNRPYYEDLLNRAPGFAKAMDLICYNFTLAGFTSSPKIKQAVRVTRRNNERREIRVRVLDGDAVKAELQTLKEIYNQAWDRNWGFVPLSDPELDEMVESLGQFLDPRLTFFAEVAGEPAGFMLGIPDLNGALMRAYPRPSIPEPITLLQVLWHWKLRSKIDRIRVPLMGVKQDFRNMGVEAAMMVELLNQVERIADEMGWRRADAGWVLETNDDMNRIVEALNAEPYKRFRFYERAFAPAPGLMTSGSEPRGNEES